MRSLTRPGHTNAYSGHMGQQLVGIASEVGCSERTMRRYLRDGLLHRRLGRARALEISEQERRYMKRHWVLLSALKSGLRTERDVRLAVLFGSVATGEDRPDSDVDIMVARRSSSPRSRGALSLRLRRALGRPVHLLDLEQAEESATLFLDIIDEGRLLVDRERQWAGLLARRADLFVEAVQEDRERASEAQHAIAAARARLP